ncbi:DNA lyase [Bifidobacterium ramosum]|uniref:DNA lyase n=1 Tax=Bifidobacterium ramosum TaxID=1798158 RepID=A0A6L4WXX0_9BIFI|nr:DNA lyase [Bifidobacterium ramosum]
MTSTEAAECSGGAADVAAAAPVRVPTPADIASLYECMERELGPTNWWPADTLFEIMVGAVLTQNTAWGNVDRSLAALKSAGVLDPHAIAALEPEALQGLIRPSGFYRNKAKTLQSLSRWYVERCGADPDGARGLTDDGLRSELLSLFGVGGETADDLVLYVFSRRAFVADTYARRLFAFLGFTVPTGYPAFHKAFAPAVLASDLTVAQLKEFHGLIDEYGKAYRDDAAKAASFLTGWRHG